MAVITDSSATRQNPFAEVYDVFDIAKEYIQLHNYPVEMAIWELKKAKEK